jgi:hypothetical protein
MLKSINQYKLKPNITKEDLIKAGFKEGGWQSKLNKLSFLLPFQL